MVLKIGTYVLIEALGINW